MFIKTLQVSSVFWQVTFQSQTKSLRYKLIWQTPVTGVVFQTPACELAVFWKTTRVLMQAQGHEHTAKLRPGAWEPSAPWLTQNLAQWRQDRNMLTQVFQPVTTERYRHWHWHPVHCMIIEVVPVTGRTTLKQGYHYFASAVSYAASRTCL